MSFIAKSSFQSSFSTLNRNSKKMASNLKILLCKEPFQNFKMNYFRKEEYDQARITTKDAIDDFLTELDYLDQILTMFPTHNANFLNQFKVYEIWINDISMMVSEQRNLKQLISFNGCDKILDQICETLETMRKQIELLKEIKNKPYQNIIKNLFPPRFEIQSQYFELATYQNCIERKERNIKKLKELNSNLIERQSKIKLINTIVERIEKTSKKLYDLIGINEKSIEKLTKEISEQINQSKQSGYFGVRTIDALLEYQVDFSKENLKKLSEIEERQKFALNSLDEKKKNIHFFFIIDVSENMASLLEDKSKFLSLKEVVDKFVMERLETDDIFTFIEFSGNALITFDQIYNEKKYLEKLRDGKANYDNAIEELQKRLLCSPRNLIPMVLFLTGGEGKCEISPDILREHIRFIHHNIIMLVGGIGKDCNFKILDMLAEAGNGGHNSIEIGNEKISLSQRISSQNDLEKMFKDFKNSSELEKIIFQEQNQKFEDEKKMLIANLNHHEQILTKNIAENMINETIKVKRTQIENLEGINKELHLEISLIQDDFWNYLNNNVSSSNEEMQILQKEIEEYEKGVEFDQYNLDKIQKDHEDSMKIIEEEENRVIENHMKTLKEAHKLSIESIRVFSIYKAFLEFLPKFDEYLNSYSQLYSFYNSLQSAFNFITLDLKRKTTLDYSLQDDSSYFGLMCNHFKVQGLEIKEDKDKENFYLIIKHLTDENTVEKIQQHPYNLFNEYPPCRLIYISMNDDLSMKEYKSLIRKMQPKIDDLEREINEKSKKLHKLSNSDLDISKIQDILEKELAGLQNQLKQVNKTSVDDEIKSLDEEIEVLKEKIEQIESGYKLGFLKVNEEKKLTILKEIESIDLKLKNLVTNKIKVIYEFQSQKERKINNITNQMKEKFLEIDDLKKKTIKERDEIIEKAKFEIKQLKENLMKLEEKGEVFKYLTGFIKDFFGRFIKNANAILASGVIGSSVNKLKSGVFLQLEMYENCLGEHY